MKIDNPADFQYAELKNLWMACFGDTDAFVDCFFSVAFSADRCLCITRENQILAAAYWLDVGFRGQKAAYVYAVATDPAHRGKGLCRALMEAIHQTLRASGYAGAMLVPGEPGLRDMYRKMGYADFGGMQTISVDADLSPIPLTQISPEMFGSLRRQYLPADGVLQEGENLAFLAQFYRFYQGEHCLFPAAQTPKGLFVPEFLGAPDVMPGILAALGASKGVFRMAGTEAFAMYHPLCSGDKPGYFAFAFD